MYVYRKWARWALLNLTIVAALGVTLRYKILFSLPFFDFKNLLHAHSHFAFSGWISLALFTAITAAVGEQGNIKLSVYTRLFAVAQLAAFGMLFTFPFMGYKGPSIAFSTLSIFFSYGFAWFAWKDMAHSRLSKEVQAYFKAALLFYVLSSLGAFHLAWLMASKNGNQSLYLGSIYFFLHFQYNGWFLFAILGLFFYQLERLPVLFNKTRPRLIFRLLFVTCFPAFLLSALWMQFPAWLHTIIVITALTQIVAMGLLWQFVWPLWKVLRNRLSPVTRWLWVFSFIALTLKFVLQGLSTIPSLSYLAFGFRPIVIGYLHLIFLGFASFFLFGYLVQQQLLPYKKLSLSGLYLFVTGALLNEVLLLIMGLAAIGNRGLPILHIFLLAAALIMFSGLICISLTFKLRKGHPAALQTSHPSQVKRVENYLH